MLYIDGPFNVYAYMHIDDGRTCPNRNENKLFRVCRGRYRSIIGIVWQKTGGPTHSDNEPMCARTGCITNELLCICTTPSLPSPRSRWERKRTMSALIYATRKRDGETVNRNARLSARPRTPALLSIYNVVLVVGKTRIAHGDHDHTRVWLQRPWRWLQRKLVLRLLAAMHAAIISNYY